MMISDNLICAGYPHEDELQGLHSGEHHQTLATNFGFKEDRGGPIICKEDDILVLVGISHSNMLSKEKGKPGLFARIFEEKEWIEGKLSTWSDWSQCDHTCISTRSRTCIDFNQSNCENGLETDFYECTVDDYTSGVLPGKGNILQPDGITKGCYPKTENILPQAKIDNQGKVGSRVSRFF